MAVDPTVTPPPPTQAGSMIRPAMALLAGLGITALVAGPGIIMATLAMLRGVADPRAFRPSPANLVVYLVINAAGAFLGGVAAARITIGRSFYTVFLLAIVLLMSGLVIALRAKDPTQAGPAWYTYGQALAVFAAALLGGWIERRRERARAQR